MRGGLFPKFMLAFVVASLLASGCTTSSVIEADQATSDPATSDPATSDLAMNEEPAAVPTSTGAPDLGSELQSTFDRTSEERSVATAIRQVDFRDGFTYETLPFGMDNGATATVADGSVENGELGDEEYYLFFAAPQGYGDLDGDGIEEAVVMTTWNGGGTGFFDSVRVYRLIDGKAERAGIVNFGDRAFGGVHSVRVEDGTVRVWSFFNGQGACCPNQIVESTLLLGEHSLVEAQRTPAVTWMPLGLGNPDRELKFLPNTSSALVWVDVGQTEASLTFEGAAGQRLLVDRTLGDNPYDVVLHDLTTGDVLVESGNSTLPTTGPYELTFPFFDDRKTGTMLEILIGDDVVPWVSWTPAIDQVLIDEDPFVRTSVTWPVFSSPGEGIDAANQVLAEFASELDDAFIAGVEEFQAPQGDSGYEVTYEVDVAADDLVSVTFAYFDFVAGQPYPNHGRRVAVLDLAAGRLIPVEEILDLARIDEINKLWFAELGRQGEIPADAIVEGEDGVRFESVSVSAEGIAFGTDRGSLGGGLPGSQTVVSFDRLGDLVNAAILDRVLA